jgi:hypothetical protein
VSPGVAAVPAQLARRGVWLVDRDADRRIPSLAAVLLVSHRAPSIEVWQRSADGTWGRRAFEPGQAAEIEALPARLLVDEIYLGLQP